jgi:hypothetical protein
MQHKKNPYRHKLFLLLVITLLAAGCLKSPNQKAIDTERLLAASGFKMRLADTPEKLTHIKALAQRQILIHKSEGELLYVYVDAEHCQCVYAGGEEAYRRYQNLAREKKLSVRQIEASREKWIGVIGGLTNPGNG